MIPYCKPSNLSFGCSTTFSFLPILAPSLGERKTKLRDNRHRTKFVDWLLCSRDFYVLFSVSYTKRNVSLFKHDSVFEIFFV